MSPSPLVLLVALALITPAAAAPADPPPRLDPAVTPPAATAPYDEAADAHADLDRALAAAKATNRRVLVDLGGNWCPDCRVLAGIMAMGEVRPWLDRHYVVVPVDVGRYTKNMDIPAHYGMPKLAGVPTVLVLEADGSLVNATNAAALTDARHMTPQAVVDYLARWAS